MVGARQNTNHMVDSPLFASPLPENPTLGVIIGAYKSTTTRLINGLRHTPGQPVWQRAYYEHIIRDDESYDRIAEYILNNPLKWEEDELYTP